jgi:peptidoglycan L-alanyl-D-glutamate endopeptidase CwlK
MALSLQMEQMAFTHDVVKLLAYIMGLGWGVTFGEVWRTEEQQKLYVQQGKSKTMNSYHRKRLAVDLNFYTPEGLLTYKHEDIAQFGAFWEGLHPQNRWGGNFQSLDDTPHFERRLT